MEGKMRATMCFFGVVLLVIASLSLPLGAEGLDEKLAFLEPLLGAPWQGEFPLLDGKRTFPITQTYESLWNINSRGGSDRGVVTLEDGKITVSGQATVNGKTHDFRNTFEVSADGTLTDRWFQNRTGSWQPGHVVVFVRGK